jgi:hypothetical protein
MTPSPNLEDASRSDERRRVPRLALTSEQFRLHPVGKIFPVGDLSRTGMAIRVREPEDLYLFSVGRHIEGILNLRREKYPVRGEVKHAGRELIGIQFRDLEEKTKEALQQFLDPAVLGAELRPLPSVGGNPFWYHAGAGVDFLLWLDGEGSFTEWMLYWPGDAHGGRYAQWKSGALSTGMAHWGQETAVVQGALRFETRRLVPDEDLDPQKLAIAKQLILSSNLPQDLRNWCSRQL